MATVSYIINGKARCGETTRLKVEKVMQELNYRPNLAAKALATKRSHLIGFVLNKGLLQSNPFYSTLLSGMDAALNREPDYDLVMGSCPDEASAQEYLCEWVGKRNLDALVLMGLQNTELLCAVDRLDLPFVLIDHQPQGFQHAISVGSDDELGGYLATRHLLKKGYKGIAFVGDDLSGEVSRLRFCGFQRALKEAGVDYSETQRFCTEVSFEGGKQIADQLVEDPNIQAVFAIADIVAFGITAHLNARGHKIPEELALIGFDNLEACQYMVPALSTIDQDVFSKGKTAVEQLLVRLRGSAQTESRVTIPLALVERQTS